MVCFSAVGTMMSKGMLSFFPAIPSKIKRNKWQIRQGLQKMPYQIFLIPKRFSRLIYGSCCSLGTSVSYLSPLLCDCRTCICSRSSSMSETSRASALSLLPLLVAWRGKELRKRRGVREWASLSEGRIKGNFTVS